jgi:hypothetical protein
MPGLIFQVSPGAKVLSFESVLGGLEVWLAGDPLKLTRPLPSVFSAITRGQQHQLTHG